MTFVSDLEPTLLWRHFDQLLTIPRGSKKEGGARQYVIAVAERNGLDHRVDETGNVLVRKAGRPGLEDAPVTILQAHLDMVQEKNSDVSHDFETDPIEPLRDGEYLTANGTTLGSDNGIGVAAMLAIMEDPDAAHGPLELLFTIDEETGMTGASGLAADVLEGRRLINLDSEEERVLTVGCAGGADTHLHLALAQEPVAVADVGLATSLTGLKGGHSGVDIHLQRGNAIKLLARALYAASLRGPVRIAGLEGGNAHNAIPREARAVLVVRGTEVDAVRERIATELEAAGSEVAAVEPHFAFHAETVQAPGQAWSAESSVRALSLLAALPHGVMAMSHDIPELVETSTNLAVVRTREDQLDVLLSSRSSVMSALQALRQRIRATGTLAGAKVDEGEGYPAWQPDMSSRVLAVVREVHRRIAGEAEIGAVHAGLECSIVAERYPGMDMISFGPQIDFPHSPDERVKIPSVAEFYAVLLGSLEALAGAA